jgi:hypothetical protein
MTAQELTATIQKARQFVEAMPPWKRDILIVSAQPTNPYSREAVVREQNADNAKKK